MKRPAGRKPVRISRRNPARIVDEDSLTKVERMDLGLALLQIAARPGVPLTSHDQWCWCGGISRQALDQRFQKAMRKLRNHLQFRDKSAWEEFRLALSHARSEAKKKATRSVT